MSIFANRSSIFANRSSIFANRSSIFANLSSIFANLSSIFANLSSVFANCSSSFMEYQSMALLRSIRPSYNSALEGAANSLMGEFYHGDVAGVLPGTRNFQLVAIAYRLGGAGEALER
jgi:hypothetical protein